MPINKFVLIFGVNYMDLIWKNNYATGFESIDSQHKKLIDILNKLLCVFDTNKEKIDLGALISELVDYTEYHFGFEEENMRNIDYPELAQHVEQHNYFRKKIYEFKEKYEKGEVYIKVALIIHLKDWIIEHICKVDARLGKFLIDLGLS